MLGALRLPVFPVHQPPYENARWVQKGEGSDDFIQFGRGEGGLWTKAGSEPSFPTLDDYSLETVDCFENIIAKPLIGGLAIQPSRPNHRHVYGR